MSLFKSKKASAPQINSYSQHRPLKLFSRKKVIAPISSEAEIRKAMVTNKAASISAKRHISKVTTNNSHAATVASKQPHLISGREAQTNAHIKAGLLSSRLDEKTRRHRRFVAVIAHVLFWAAVYYVFFS